MRQEIQNRGLKYRDVAASLGMGVEHLYDVMRGGCNLSRTIAVRLYRVGIDGRALYLRQAIEQLRYFEDQERRVIERGTRGDGN